MGSLTLDARKDLTTGRALLRHSDLGPVLIPRSLTVTWTGTTDPVVEPDTIYLFNAAQEQKIPQGTPGGFIADGGYTNGTQVAWTSPAATVAPASPRAGLQVNERTKGSVFIMPTGLIDPTSFHIEMTLIGDSDWASFPDSQNLFYLGTTDSADNITLAVSSGASPKLTLIYQHTQDPTVASRAYTLSQNLTVGLHPASTKVRVAFSMTPAGTLTLYVDGVQAAQQTGCVPAHIFDGGPANGSFSIGGFSNLACEHMQVFSLRISRAPRVPGVPITVTDANVLTVSPASTTGATINRKLCGINKHFKGLYGAEAANGSPSNPAANVIRTGGMPSSTPVKAGAPDATHPTLGQSGLYSYDFTWVDRTIHHIANDQGCEPYITLASCPQLLGGTTAPYSNLGVATNGAQAPDLTGVLNLRAPPTGTPAVSYIYEPSIGNVYRYSGGGGNTRANVTLVWGTPGHVIPDNTVVQIGPQECSQAVFDKTVPNDFAAFGHLCGDHLDHIINTLGVPVPYASVWNEADGSFWTGTEAQYISMYQATASAIRSVVPSVKIVGWEMAQPFAANMFRLQDLVNACASGGQALDSISVHPYRGNLAVTAIVNANLKRFSTAAGRATPPTLILGEYDYSGSIGSGVAIPADYYENDWQAAHLARMLLECQLAGNPRLIFLDQGGLWDNVDNGNLFTKSGNPFAPWNVMKMWAAMMAPNVVASTLSDGGSGVADPGLAAIASTDGAGKTTVFIANIHFKKWNEPQVTPPQTIQVNVTGAVNGTPVQCWMIDDERSNQFDAGVLSAALTQVTVPAIQGGATYIPMKARSVALVQVGP